MLSSHSIEKELSSKSKAVGASMCVYIYTYNTDQVANKSTNAGGWETSEKKSKWDFPEIVSFLF